jgi:hypothetical protein
MVPHPQKYKEYTVAQAAESYTKIYKKLLSNYSTAPVLSEFVEAQWQERTHA